MVLKVTFIDLETTSKNPNTAEILTSYASTRDVHNEFNLMDELYLTFRPEKYLLDSYHIHKISKDESNTFDNKWDSLRKLLQYFSHHNDGLFCCHANHCVYGAYGYFDEQVLRSVSAFNSSKAYYWFLNKRFRWISTHTIAKRELELKKYDLHSLSNFYNYEFKHHDCKQDVKAMEYIFRKLVPKDINLNDLYIRGNYDGINR